MADEGPGALLEFDGQTVRLAPGGQAPQPGEFIVSVTDGGFLRKVESVQVAADDAGVVRTSEATLAEAVGDGDFMFTDGPATGKNIVPAKKYQVFRLDSSLNRCLYERGGATLDTVGAFSMDLTLDLEISIRDFRLEHFLAAVEGATAIDLQGKLALTVGSTFGTTGDGVALLSPTPRKYLYGVIGGVPVAIEVSAQLYAGLEGNAGASASFDTGFSASSRVRAGGRYDRGNADPWRVISEQGFNFTPVQPGWCVQGNLGAKVFLKPVIEIQLYTVVGPKFTLEPYLRFDANGSTCGGPGQQPSGTYTWTLAAGLTGQGLIKADILDRYVLESPPLTLFNREWELLSGSGTGPLEAVSTPTFSPDGGTFTTSQNVAIACATSGVTIRYTTDGSTPSRTNGTMISNGSSVNLTSTTTLKAIAYKDGMTDSAVTSATYTEEEDGSLLAPRDVTASQGVFTNKIHVTWNTVSGAEGYDLFRNTTNNANAADWIGTYATGTADQHDDSISNGLVAGTTYYYWVRAKKYNPVMLSGFSSAATGWLVDSPSVLSCSVTPTLLDFGSVATGDTAVLDIAIENTGTEDFEIDTDFDGDGNWFWWGAANSTLQPGDTATVHVQFQPQSAGTKYASVSFGNAVCAEVDCVGTGTLQLPNGATNPSPPNGATERSINTNVSWSNSGGATSYKVYFGTDSTPDSGEYQGTQDSTSYDPGTLAYSTTYYWRIDATNSAGTTTGEVWSFTTESPQSVTIFSEGFEGSFPGPWTVRDEYAENGDSSYWDDVDSSFGGEGTHGGNWKGYCVGSYYGGTSSLPYYPSWIASTMERLVDLRGYSSATLTFWYKMPSILSCSDGAYVIVQSTPSPGLTSWTRNTARTSWTKVTMDLSDHVGKNNVKIAFLFVNADCGGNAEGWYLDDIVLVASP